MWQKAFHVALVTFLVVFSAAVIVLLMAPLTMFILPADSHGIFAYSGGLSIPVLKFIAFLLLLSGVLIISFVARKRRLR